MIGTYSLILLYASYSVDNQMKINTFCISSYGVFALGNRSYPSFCGFGTWLDKAFSELSGRRLVKIGYGDELGDRDLEFKKWSKMAYKQACLETNVAIELDQNNNTEEMINIATKWIALPLNSTENCTSSAFDEILEGITEYNILYYSLS